MRVGRNEACPCGSGKKFKACCAGKASTRTSSRGLILLLALIGAVAAVGLVGVATANREEPQAALPPARPATPGPQPAGAAPPGKVWSEEHGHWHDAAPSPRAASPVRIETTPLPAAAPRPSTPQPAGRPPAGKVWSAEHGHWHDAQ